MRRVALLPWGDVIEDYLDAIGTDLAGFCRQDGGWLFGYVRALGTAGVASVLVVVSRSVRRPTRLRHEPTGAPLWALPPGRGARRSPWLATPLPALARVLRQERCDAVLCQEHEYTRFDACVALGAVLRLPVFATAQGGTPPAGRLEAAVRRRTVPRAAALLVADAREAERTARTYRIDRRRVARVPNPIDLGAWPPLDRSTARSALGVPSRARVVAWHGRVAMRHKGLDVLVRAWGEVERALPDPDVRLRLLGGGPDADELRHALAALDPARVEWEEGYTMEREHVRRFLAAADVYVFPSRHEGSPVAPLEAMASGLPVVAAAAPGVDDLVGDGEDAGGVVVPVDDAAALAAGLVALLADPDRAQELGRRARRRVAQVFSLEPVGARLAGVLAGR